MSRKYYVIIPLVMLLIIQLNINNSSIIAKNYIDPTINNQMNETWNLWLNTYKLVAKLSRMGYNVTQYTRILNYTYTLINKGKYSEASKILEKEHDKLINVISTVESRYYTTQILYYLNIIFVLIVPVIAYIIIPRIYLILWFKTHKNWVVEK